MKFQLLNYFVFALGCLISISANAYDVAIENEDGVTIYYNYINNKKELSVTDSNSKNTYSGDIKIPASVTIDNAVYRVVDIEKGAFYECKDLTSVEIPSSITSIGRKAFAACNALTAVYITDISAWLKIDFFEDYLTQASEEGIVGIILSPPSSNPLSYAHHLYLNGNEVTELKVPDDVTAICDYAFAGCTGLISVQISSNVTTIGNFAFYGCTNLTSVQMSSSTTKIGEHFSIGYGTFRQCYRLRSLYLSSTTPPYIAYHSKSLLNYFIPEEVLKYAYVHIPMGSYEAYSSTYGWRLFERFKEDVSMDGTPFYVKLNVANDNSKDFVEQYVKVDESYTVKFGKRNGVAVKRVMFNGEDVTRQIDGGSYTTPRLTKDSEITIEYDELENDVNGDGRVDTQDVIEIYDFMQKQ